MNKDTQDRLFMTQALRLAAKAKGRTSPNPMVGAVIVKDGTVVGTGYHRRAGSPHAEILAMQDAGPRVRGATLYVTLEPCCHTSKRTPPCAPAIRYSGLQRVVVAMRDPNAKVKGKGIAQLQRAGVDVSVGCLEADARQLNESYVHWMTTGRPFITLKAAMTLDGKIATAQGESKWITGEKARDYVHQLRSQVDGIMVGIGTVQADNPELSVRQKSASSRSTKQRQPVRVVLDSRLRIPPKAKVLRWVHEQPTIICTTKRASQKKIQQLEGGGAQVLVCAEKNGRVSLSSCLNRLGKLNLTSLLVEGGSEVHASILREGYANRVQLYVAPKLIGGQDAKGVIGGVSPKTLAQGWNVADIQIKKLGQDFLITGNCVKKNQ